MFVIAKAKILRFILVVLLCLGCATSIYGAWFWVKTGFRFSIEEVLSLLLVQKPWNLNKDSSFYVMIIGLLVAVYCAIELQLKRWESK